MLDHSSLGILNSVFANLHTILVERYTCLAREEERRLMMTILSRLSVPRVGMRFRKDQMRGLRRGAGRGVFVHAARILSQLHGQADVRYRGQVGGQRVPRGGSGTAVGLEPSHQRQISIGLRWQAALGCTGGVSTSRAKLLLQAGQGGRLPRCPLRLSDLCATFWRRSQSGE